ncbi:MAG: efflux RND transporter periplasmic adaptor subunit [candidate division KSB1 bacterium]|nr:efflux RND transporter periplasmic adaptor subunit [candidate division KSB1 bacterium]
MLEAKSMGIATRLIRGRWPLVMAVVVLSGLGSSCGRNSSPKPDPRMMGTFADRSAAALPVEVAIARRDTVSHYILATTSLEPERAVDVIAKVSGVVVELRAEEGDVVREGEVLARIDDRELKVALDQAAARLENAQQAFERAKQMFERNLASKEAYEQARLELQTAQAQHDAARLQWEYSRIRAPIGGVITQRFVDLGDMVNPNTVVFAMADFEPLLARIHVPEKDIGKITVGQMARITVEPAPDRVFWGRVRMISPVVDAATGTVKVTVEISKRDGILRPGMFASVYLLTDTHPNALVIPKKSLVLESERDMVFVIRNGRAHEVPVKLGYTNGDKVEVLEGLAEGDTVITVGQEGLREGMPVRVVAPGGAAPVAVASAAAEAVPAAGGPAAQAPLPGGPGASGPITEERLRRIEARAFQIPGVQEEYRKKLQDPAFAGDLQARARFLFEKMRAAGGGPPRRPEE